MTGKYPWKLTLLSRRHVRRMAPPRDCHRDVCVSSWTETCGHRCRGHSEHGVTPCHAEALQLCPIQRPPFTKRVKEPTEIFCDMLGTICDLETLLAQYIHVVLHTRCSALREQSRAHTHCLIMATVLAPYNSILPSAKLTVSGAQRAC